MILSIMIALRNMKKGVAENIEERKLLENLY